MSTNSDHVLIHYGCRLCTLNDEDAKQNGYTPQTRPKKKKTMLYHFWLPPGSQWVFRFSGIFNSVAWWLVSEVSGHPIPLTLNGQVVQKKFDPWRWNPYAVETSVSKDCESTLINIAEDRRSMLYSLTDRIHFFNRINLFQNPGYS